MASNKRSTAIRKYISNTNVNEVNSDQPSDLMSFISQPASTTLLERNMNRVIRFNYNITQIIEKYEIDFENDFDSNKISTNVDEDRLLHENNITLNLNDDKVYEPEDCSQAYFALQRLHQVHINKKLAFPAAEDGTSIERTYLSKSEKEIQKGFNEYFNKKRRYFRELTDLDMSNASSPISTRRSSFLPQKNVTTMQEFLQFCIDTVPNEIAEFTDDDTHSNYSNCSSWTSASSGSCSDPECETCINTRQNQLKNEKPIVTTVQCLVPTKMEVVTTAKTTDLVELNVNVQSAPSSSCGKNFYQMAIDFDLEQMCSRIQDMVLFRSVLLEATLNINMDQFCSAIKGAPVHPLSPIVDYVVRAYKWSKIQNPTCQPHEIEGVVQSFVGYWAAMGKPMPQLVREAINKKLNQTKVANELAGTKPSMAIEPVESEKNVNLTAPIDDVNNAVATPSSEVVEEEHAECRRELNEKQTYAIRKRSLDNDTFYCTQIIKRQRKIELGKNIKSASISPDSLVEIGTGNNDFKHLMATPKPKEKVDSWVMDDNPEVPPDEETFVKKLRQTIAYAKQRNAFKKDGY